MWNWTMDGMYRQEIRIDWNGKGTGEGEKHQHQLKKILKKICQQRGKSASEMITAASEEDTFLVAGQK